MELLSACPLHPAGGQGQEVAVAQQGDSPEHESLPGGAGATPVGSPALGD